jgi:hypothetical protein
VEAQGKASTTEDGKQNLVERLIIQRSKITKSINLLDDIKFCVFAEVLELTEGWAYLLKNSDLKHEIDEIFVIRDGKRKNKGNKPVKANLERFKKYIETFLLETK